MKKLIFLIAILITTALSAQTLKVGQHWKGGLIFYLNPDGKTGYVAPVDGYIPISPKSSKCMYSNQCMWGAAPQGGLGTDTRIGTGRHNTKLMMRSKDDILPYISADEYCTSFTVKVCDTTYADWFLPSKDELNLLYLQKSFFDGLGGTFWSSSQYDDNTAWTQDISTGAQNHTTKYDIDHVRAVRVF